ncbi:MAG: poly(3-hydroxybutyrate) depolymerase [Acidimicrobiales bacterium]|nr:poly(3-hydroxybutyrate) depolymerase [Acidimicrobiales bacterium]
MAMHRDRFGWSRALVGAVAVTAALAACSSGGSDASPTTDASTRRSTTTGASTTRTVDPSSVPADPSAGCRGSIHTTSGNEKVATASGGMDRWYFVNVPSSNTADTPQPLILDLHGYLEGADLHAGVSGLSALGQFEGFVTVTPQGQGDLVHWDTRLTSPDITFVNAVLDHVEQTTCIDKNREYATGFSNGAFLTSTLACTDSERFAAVAPVAGIRDVPGCKPKRPVPVIAFHGTADEFVVYKGGIGSGAKKLPAVDSKQSGETMGEADPKSATDILPGDINDTVPEILATWSKRNGCTGKETVSKVSSDVDLLHETCPAGDEAELYRVTGGGHAWPGSVVGATLDSVTGHTTTSVDATKLMWAFFEAHPLRKA